MTREEALKVARWALEHAAGDFVARDTVRHYGGIDAIMAALEPQAPATAAQLRVSDPPGGLVIACDRCGQTLTQPGALHFTSPDRLGMVRKLHICVTCEEHGSEPQALSAEDKAAIAASSREICALPVCCYDADDVIDIVHGAGFTIVRVKPSEVACE